MLPNNMCCTYNDIQPLYLMENFELSYPDAWMCRLHRQTFASSKDAKDHVDRVQEGNEQRNGGRKL